MKHSWKSVKHKTIVKHSRNTVSGMPLMELKIIHFWNKVKFQTVKLLMSVRAIKIFFGILWAETTTYCTAVLFSKYFWIQVSTVCNKTVLPKINLWNLGGHMVQCMMVQKLQYFYPYSQDPVYPMIVPLFTYYCSIITFIILTHHVMLDVWKY